MAVPWGLVTFLVGLLYGWLSPGRQDKSKLFRNGILIGLVLAIVLGILGLAFKLNPLGLGLGLLDLFFSVLVLTLLFLLGVWVGDLIEGAKKKGTG